MSTLYVQILELFFKLFGWDERYAKLEKQTANSPTELII